MATLAAALVLVCMVATDATGEMKIGGSLTSLSTWHELESTEESQEQSPNSLTASPTGKAFSINKPPQFVDFQTSVFLPEDLPIGFVVITLFACGESKFDLKLGMEGDLSSQMLHLASGRHFDCSKYDVKGPGIQANVTLKQSLDRENVDRYYISFTVSDSVNAVKRFSTLHVTDVNDNTPTFIGLPYETRLAEDSANGTSVFQVSSKDPDTGLGGLVEYSLKEPSSLFIIAGASGVIRLTGTLDYEHAVFHQLEIVATDRYGMNTTANLIIHVTDVQDRPPSFINLPYSAKIYENTTTGTSILQVEALDGDRGVPNRLNYTILHDERNLSSYFNISADTGWIYLQTRIDREDSLLTQLFGVIELTVKTEEISTESSVNTMATAPVTITVLDVNDTLPLSSPQHKIQEEKIDYVMLAGFCILGFLLIVAILMLAITLAMLIRKWRGEAKVHPLPSQAQTEEARIEGS